MGKRTKRSFLDSLLILAGGIAGGAIGWFVAQDWLAQYAARAGVRLGADHRGPVIMGCVFFGWIFGTVAAFVADEVWRSLRGRKAQSPADET